MGRCWQLFIVTENSFINLRRPGGHAEPMADEVPVVSRFVLWVLTGRTQEENIYITCDNDLGAWLGLSIYCTKLAWLSKVHSNKSSIHWCGLFFFKYYRFQCHE